MTAAAAMDPDGIGRPRRADLRTPVTILTGFLGSGKTSLLNAALADPRMARTMVIINEFGEIAIDNDLTASSDDTITVLDNGCLCCTVFGDLVGLLQQLYHRREAGDIERFERVVIETTGLANPVPVAQAFLSDPALAGLYRLDGVLATVDLHNALGTLAQHIEAVQQVAVAETVVLTKADMAGGNLQALWDSVTSAIRQVNPAASLLDRTGAAFDPAAVFLNAAGDPSRGGEATLHWLNAEAYLSQDCSAGCDDPAHAHHAAGHRHSTDISSYCLLREQPSTREGLNLLLIAIEQNLGPGLLRVKGLVAVAEEPDRPAVIHGAQHLLHNVTFLDRWPSEDHRTRIVFIVQGIAPDVLEEMVSLLDRVAARTAAAKARAQGTGS